jgi:PAS domain S-box-containing protein
MSSEPQALERHEPGLAALRALVDIAPDGIFVADLVGRLTFVNAAGCRLLGYSADELLGRMIREMILEEDLERMLESKAGLLTGTSHIGEWRLRCKDGTCVPVEVNAAMTADGQWYGFVRDIAERKAQEAEREILLQDTEAARLWLQTVVDTLPVGVVLFHPDGRLIFNGRSSRRTAAASGPSR